MNPESLPSITKKQSKNKYIILLILLITILLTFIMIKLLNNNYLVKINYENNSNTSHSVMFYNSKVITCVNQCVSQCFNILSKVKKRSFIPG